MRLYLTRTSEMLACRPRRHREDATGVVVAFFTRHDSAMGKNCGRQPTTDWDERRNHTKNLHSNGPPCRMARHTDGTLLVLPRKSKLISSTSRLFHFITEAKASLIAADAPYHR